MFLTFAVGVSLVCHLDDLRLRIRRLRFLRLPTCCKLSLEAVEQQLTMDCMRSSEKRMFSARFSRDCFCVGGRSVPSLVSKRVGVHQWQPQRARLA